MTMLGFRSGFDQRDRLVSLMQAHPNFARHNPLRAGEFPHDILPFDPTTVDKTTDVSVCMVVPGQIIDEYSVGPGGTGQITLVGSVLLLIYLFNTPVDMTTPETWLTQKQQREALLGKYTLSAIQAILSYPVDPTPGDQMWNVMRLAPTALGLHTTYYSTDVFHQSKTRINLHGQMYRPARPSGTLSTP